MPFPHSALLSRFARLLESPSGPLTHPFLNPFLARPLVLPPGAQVFGIGSAVIGGAGKTPVAIEYAKRLKREGIRVAFVSHAYAARPQGTRRVSPDSPVDEVGDDALLAARALQLFDIPVFCGPSRQLALNEAAKNASCLVIDGILQSRPQRLAHSVLVLDAYAPFGSRRTLPFGDLRASPEACLAACDEVVLVSDAAIPPGRISFPLPRLSSFATIDLDTNVPLDALRTSKLGLISAIARPNRLVDSLGARGIFPTVIHHGQDHRGLSATDITLLNGFDLDFWLVTEKCAQHLCSRALKAPLVVLHTITRLDPVAQAC